MNTRLVFAMSLFSGLLGGLVSHYSFPVTAYAQQTPPKEIRAQSFALVDDQNNVVGRITTSPAHPATDLEPARPRTVVIQDRDGQELWPGVARMVEVTPSSSPFRPLGGR